VTTNFLLLSQ